jgi:galactokinase
MEPGTAAFMTVPWAPSKPFKSKRNLIDKADVMTGMEVVAAKYKQVFGREGALTSWAPGRVNLIGEHTDYNEGYVLPLAVDRGIRIAGGAREDRTIRLHSVDYDSTVTFSLNSLTPDSSNRWADYFKGVVDELQKRGIHLNGCDAVIQGDLPRGAGLSSSAALEVASAVFLQSASGFTIPDIDMVRVAQDAENNFVGLRCGIMDMYASYMGQAGSALRIDCRDLSYQLAPMPKGIKIVVCNTGVARTLAGSAYNERRAECEEGVRILSGFLPEICALRDVSPAAFKAHEASLPEVVRKRVRHVVSEDQRVLDTVSAMGHGDLSTLGRLMYESHESLRVDYQVSCKELDELVDIARGCPGVVGARMTGAGFGGCTVALVEEDSVSIFEKKVAQSYRDPLGHPAEVYVFTAADGAKAAQGRFS